MSERILIGNIAYTLSEKDKAELVAQVKNSLNKETWTFTLEDGSVVTKAVVLDD